MHLTQKSTATTLIFFTFSAKTGTIIVSYCGASPLIIRTPCGAQRPFSHRLPLPPLAWSTNVRSGASHLTQLRCCTQRSLVQREIYTTTLQQRFLRSHNGRHYRHPSFHGFSRGGGCPTRRRPLHWDHRRHHHCTHRWLALFHFRPNGRLRGYFTACGIHLWLRRAAGSHTHGRANSGGYGHSAAGEVY